MIIVKEFYEYLKKLRENINVDLLGVVEYFPLEDIYEKMKSNRELGFYTSFENEDINKRTDPKEHLKNPKSIFVIGMSYIWDYEKNTDFPVSNHSMGIDYHKVLKERLEQLEKELSKTYTFNSYKQVDSGDLYEKELARLAGFGYLGKNSLLINEKYGSYIFLGILVTDIKLENYSEEYVGSCKDCNICEISCPSGSILGDYRIDSSICHSYLTQSKIETDETKNIKYSYGCDICQEVCPKNKGILKNKNKEFKPLITGFEKEKIENMSNKGFKRTYKDFSFSWVGKKVILRNIENISARGRK